jgi:hypothetical protein
MRGGALDMDGEADSATVKLERGHRVVAAIRYPTGRRGTRVQQQAGESPPIDEGQGLR